MTDNRLWFRRPAAAFTESCPLGNGRLGAMLFGGVTHERVVLNESTMWSGSPQEAERPDAHRALPHVRRLLLEGRNPEAEALVEEAFVCRGKGSGQAKGKDLPYGCYQTLGDLRLEFADAERETTDYRRELDLNDAVARVTYRQNEVTYDRQCFVSAPAQILVLRLEADTPGALSLTATCSRPERARLRCEGNQVILEGQLHNGTDGDGTRFQARLGARLEGGSLAADGDGLHISRADGATLYLAAGTNLADPDFETHVREQLETAMAQPFGTLREEHVADCQRFLKRCRLSLPSTPNSDLPTPERLTGFAEGAADPALAALYFNYGRYLLISSSRPESPLPANLQGLWAEELQTPWNGDFHLDINVQMNYWPAGPTGLVDCQWPLVRLIESLVEPGRTTARAYYDARGWVAHVITNPWGFTAPGERASWGATTSGSAWLCEHLWEHYQFSLDKEYLARIYPVLRESAEFYLDMLIEEPTHAWLVTAPANSPENSFRLPDGSEAHVCMGPTIDMQLLRELFANVIAAATILDVDVDFRGELEHKRGRLAPHQIGRHGQLQEWLEDYEEPDPHHRHTSHLYGLFPAHQITDATPELFAAARVSLERRGDESTGWSLAWRAALWARLMDGQRAHRLLRNLLRPVSTTGYAYHGGGGVYGNLFCAHPPFQIDGNFGGTAAIAEMLLQSHEVVRQADGGECRVLRLLPALPSAWPTGRVIGLRARGGVRLDQEWADGRLVAVSLSSSHDQICILRYRDREVSLQVRAGLPITLDGKLE